MLAVTGIRSRIVEELRPLLPEGEEVVRIDDDNINLPICERYLLCAGLLRPKRMAEQSRKERAESMEVNLLRPVALCEQILEWNDAARICIVGSESGFSWSYDGTYAAAKAALHRYVETKELKPNQQLVCVAPSIISDARMTQVREDLQNLENRRENHPKKRFLKSVEVARLIHFLLYVDEGYLSNTVIRMNGGGR